MEDAEVGVEDVLENGRERREGAWANLWGGVGVIFLRLVELIEV